MSAELWIGLALIAVYAGFKTIGLILDVEELRERLELLEGEDPAYTDEEDDEP